ncbi:MAG: PIN domain-containing protein [Candidatus Nanoarchaeia archaeon]|nr:PIN domain-containing protein [Candidatus Nanoarchaeia archaeon]MDD5239234.1 PIN domain-containing protein [Candidatus Nanoarchaeia archaeon]
MQKLYLDANIYYNFWKDETVKKVIPAGLRAEELFNKIKEEDCILVVSDFLVKLVQHNSKLFGALLDEKLAEYKTLGKLELINVDAEVIAKAEALLKKYRYKYETVDWEDLVNFLLAKKAGALLVTRDEELRALANEEGVTAVYPEDVLKS